MASKAGDYNRRITVQSITDGSPDSRGERSQTVATYDVLWAKVEPLRGREFYSSDSSITHHAVVFKVRYSTTSAAITADGYQVLYGGNVYDLESVVDVDEGHKEVHIRGVRRD